MPNRASSKNELAKDSKPKVDNIRVAVRLRPLNQREKKENCQIYVDMVDNQTIVYDKNDPTRVYKKYTFDECFWSINSSDEKYSSQEYIFETLGRDVIKNTFEGYNSCIFAYGQTGSGKSYTMMGSESQPGLIPRLCEALFQEVKSRNTEVLQYVIGVSYYEIYMEKVSDLLKAKHFNSMHSNEENLQVHSDSNKGFYVANLTQTLVKNAKEIEMLIISGNKSRTVAATTMNEQSSRSHAVFEISLFEMIMSSSDSEDPNNLESADKENVPSTKGRTAQDLVRKAKINLVDLAGSEKIFLAGKSKTIQDQGKKINLSLLELMNVISELAKYQAEKKRNPKLPAPFINYRNSVLTKLLKESIGGNSKTVMITNVSPSLLNYSETLSSLSYADTAKKIENCAIVNESKPNKEIQKLEEEIERLKTELESKHVNKEEMTKLENILKEKDEYIKQITKPLEEKLKEGYENFQALTQNMEKRGICMESWEVKLNNDMCYLTNLNADPLLNGILKSYLKDCHSIGSGEDQNIQIQGLGIKSKHCIIEVTDKECNITPLEDAKTYVNGKLLSERTLLKHGDRILWGNHHYYKIIYPSQENNNIMTTSTEESSPEDEFYRAQEEVMMNQMDPLKQVRDDLEKRYATEKDKALALQKEEFDKQMALLKQQYSLALNQIPNEMECRVTSPVSNITNSSQFGSMMNLPPNTSFGNIPQQSGAYAWMGSQQNLFSSHNIAAQIKSRYLAWVQEKERNLSITLVQLRKQLTKANALTREANFLSEEMAKGTEYSVTLQIPAASLKPGRNKNDLISEPAILVKRDDKPKQIWSLEKLENKVMDMKKLYEEWKDTSCPNRTPLGNPFNTDSDFAFLDDEVVKDDPFFDTQEEHCLIGVANVYLACLFQKIKFRYHVPIINQQGEVSGKLCIELSLVEGELPDLAARENVPISMANSNSNNNNSVSAAIMMTSSMSSSMYSTSTATGGGGGGGGGGLPCSSSGYNIGSQVKIRVSVMQATNLPEELSHFVFCQFNFWGQLEPTVVAPVLQPDYMRHNVNHRTTAFKFNCVTDFKVSLTDDLLEHLAQDALSIEIFGNRSPGYSALDSPLKMYSRNGGMSTGVDQGDGKIRSQTKPKGDGTEGGQSKALVKKFAESWMELYRRLELWVSIEELNQEGQYEKVEVLPLNDAATGGVFQLQHGYSRRLRVFARPNKIFKACRGRLPLQCNLIDQVYVGDVIAVKSNSMVPLDSYQEKDLNRLRESWTEAVKARQIYLNAQLQKAEPGSDREKRLMAEWMRYTEEHNLLMCPPPGSGIPGAQATWSPVQGMERHCPIVFINMKDIEPTAGYLSESDLDQDNDTGDDEHNQQSGGGGVGGQQVAEPSREYIPCSVDLVGNVSAMFGSNCRLPNTSDPDEENFLALPITKRYADLWGALCIWDSSLHNSIFLNRVTQNDERIYLTVKVVMKLQTPAMVDLVLRKRISVRIGTHRQSITSFFKKKLKILSNNDADSDNRVIWSGVTYQVVSGIPQSFQELEDRKTLAQLAAASVSTSVKEASDNPEDDSVDKESLEDSTDNNKVDEEELSYMERYIRSVSAVESLFELDRIRQEAVAQEIAKEMRRKQQESIRKGLPFLPYQQHPQQQQQQQQQQLQHQLLQQQQHPLAYQTDNYRRQPMSTLVTGMFRSSSLVNLNGIFEQSNSAFGKTNNNNNNHIHNYKNNNNNNKHIQHTDFNNLVKSGSISNLDNSSMEQSDNIRRTSIATAATATPDYTQSTPLHHQQTKSPQQSSRSTEYSKMPIKPALIPKRPAVPKNLAALSKDQSLQQMLNRQPGDILGSPRQNQYPNRTTNQSPSVNTFQLHHQQPAAAAIINQLVNDTTESNKSGISSQLALQMKSTVTDNKDVSGSNNNNNNNNNNIIEDSDLQIEAN